MIVRSARRPGLASAAAAGLAALAAVAAGPCAAQGAWKPERPVEFVVLSAPGGGNDRTEALEKDFRNARAMRELLARDYESERRLLVELGMAK